MAEVQKDFLLTLIRSLSKSEKRQFRLYVNRLGINSDAKFLLLFDEMDRMIDYDESRILNKKITSKQQISNLKAHLYRQILISLRMNPSNQNNKILIREQLDFATMLYNKGLYKQSLKILDKTKQNAIELEEKDIAFYTSNGGTLRKATPGNFFIFFPQDVHRPCVKEKEQVTVKKLVVKMKVD